MPVLSDEETKSHDREIGLHEAPTLLVVASLKNCSKLALNVIPPAFYHKAWTCILDKWTIDAEESGTSTSNTCSTSNDRVSIRADP